MQAVVAMSAFAVSIGLWGCGGQTPTPAPTPAPTPVPAPAPESCPANADVPACTATAPGSRAVRRAIQDLSSEQLDKFSNAVWVMKNTALADGQTTYGNSFRTYDYFVVKHAVAALDTRGDQMHFADSFATAHGLFLREFEANLMLIDPTIEGLPYWDSETDVFTNDLFGSLPGTGPNGEVVDGMFANFPMNTAFDMSDWNSYLQPITDASNGFDPQHGFLRGADNTLNTTVLTRCGESMTFTASQQQVCVDTPQCWSDWQSCIDGNSDNWHSLVHITIGGSSDLGDCDMMDPFTSPNDPFFMPFHAGLDRNRLKWMEAHSDLFASYYGYGGLSSGCLNPPGFQKVDCSEFRGPNPYPMTAGIELTDVVSAMWPYTSAQLNLDGIQSEGLTHADALCFMGPTTAPYEYVDPVARTFSASSSSSRAETPNSFLSSSAWYWAIGLIVPLFVFGGAVAAGLCRKRHLEEGATANGGADDDDVELRTAS